MRWGHVATLSPMWPHLLYLLHAVEPSTRAHHYIGITTPAGFAARMRAHAMGYGARLTSKWFTDNTPVVIAAVAGPASYDAERRVKRSKGFRHFCPVCAGSSEGVSLGTYSYTPQEHVPNDAPAWSALNLPTRKRPA